LVDDGAAAAANPDEVFTGEQGDSRCAVVGCTWWRAPMFDGTPDAHLLVVEDADVHSSIQAHSVVDEEGVKVESPQRSEENRP
jgi:hypothetical protein